MGDHKRAAVAAADDGEEQDNYYQAAASGMGNYHYQQDHPHHLIQPTSHHQMGSSESFLNSAAAHHPQHHLNINDQAAGCSSSALDRSLSFADVMQFADFGPKLALNHQNNSNNTTVIKHQISSRTSIRSEEDTTTSNTMNATGNNITDPVYFLEFPVLSDHSCRFQQHQQQEEDMNNVQPMPLPRLHSVGEFHEEEEEEEEEVEAARLNHFLGGSSSADHIGAEDDNHRLPKATSCSELVPVMGKSNTTRRKRPRSVKTSEEVESQRMTHIAVERNRRKQMNEHLRVLRSLMPGSYVQRGDQASIIGGAIEFVRELEQLLQCLESQKRRRLYGSSTSTDVVQNRPIQQQQIDIDHHQQPPALAYPHHPNNIPLPAPNDFEELPSTAGGGGGLPVHGEDMAENKTSLADVEVKVLGFDAMIKILSRRRPGQLLKTIAALEDLQLNILHTNITTIEQTVLYSFNVKVAGDTSFTAEDIATSVQQIFSFIHASSSSTTTTTLS